jgi:hypothetical protein
MNTKKTLFYIVSFLAIIILLTGCAPGNERFDTDPAGFWWGLWHGLISLIAFIVSLFNDDWTIYEINNNGKMYNLGFILGCIIFYSGGIFGSKKRKS